MRGPLLQERFRFIYECLVIVGIIQFLALYDWHEEEPMPWVLEGYTRVIFRRTGEVNLIFLGHQSYPLDGSSLHTGAKVDPYGLI